MDIEIRDGIIEAVYQAGSADFASFDENDRYDADGRLVTPTLVEPHTHIDIGLSAGNPRWSQTGTLEEGWRLWDERKSEITIEGTKRRAKKIVTWFVANGITKIRTHVDTSAPDNVLVEALLELREELSDVVDLQLVAALTGSPVTNEDQLRRLNEALERGLDLVGGMPHKENTREDGVEHIKIVVDLARKYNKGLDLHIDETDDPHSRYTGVLADQALQHGIGEDVTASHTTALHSYPNAYADKLIHMLAESGVSVITNPLANAALQGRYDDYPRRRGHTRIDELRDAGVTVGVGQDDVMDNTYHYGNGDPLGALYVLMHFAHMDDHASLSALWEMLLDGNAEIFGVDNYGLKEGAEGSLTVFDSPDTFNALRTQSPRTLVLKNGRIVAHTAKESAVNFGQTDQQVEFNHVP